MRSVIAGLLLSLIPGPALADVLFLEGGGRVEGVVTEAGEVLLVRMVHGTARIRRAEVKHREAAPYVTEILAARRARLDPRDAGAHASLAAWCREQGLVDEARALWTRTLEIDPDHAGARSALGQVRQGDRWMTPEEAREERLAALGFVRVGGRRLTPEGLLASLRAGEETVRLDAEEASRRAAREREEREERIAKELAAKAEAERKAAEAAAARAGEERAERERLAGENAALRVLVDQLLRERESGWWWTSWTPGTVVPRVPAGPRVRCGGGRGWWSPALRIELSRGRPGVAGVVR